MNVRNFLEFHKKIFTNFLFLPFLGFICICVKKFDVPLFDPEPQL